MGKSFLLICFCLFCTTTAQANGAFQQGGKRDWSQRINKFKAPYKLREIKDFEKEQQNKVKGKTL